MALRLTAALIRAAIPKADRIKLNDNNLFDIEMALIKHILHVASYNEYSKATKPFIKTAIAKNIRNEAMLNFAIIVQLKCALLNILKKGITNQEKIREVFTTFELTDHTRLIEGLKRDRVYGKATAKAREALVEFKNVQDIKRTCTNIIRGIDGYLKGFSYRKLRFIAKSNNSELDDLIADLQAKAIRSFYHTIPFKSPQHTVNTVKRAAHNEGINLIKKYTAGKRTRLTANDNGGFDSTLISMFYNSDGANGEGEEENFAISKNNIDKEYNSIEVRTSFAKLIEVHGNNPNKKRVLDLFTMKPDPEFSAVAASLYPTLVKKTQTTEEIFDKLGAFKFHVAIRKTLNADKEDFNRFISTVKKAM